MQCLDACMCVFTSIHREGFICLGLEFQGTDQRCCVEDVTFLCQVPSLILQYEAPSLSKQPFYDPSSVLRGVAILGAWVLGYLSAWVLWDSYFTYEVSFFEITGLLELFTASVRPVNTDLQCRIIREMVPLERAALLEKIQKGIEKQLKKRLQMLFVLMRLNQTAAFQIHNLFKKILDS